jgi:hypothetical protein
MSGYKYEVEVLVFKPSGKYYETLGYPTNAETMYGIVDEFEAGIKQGHIPYPYTYVLTGKQYQSNKELSFGFPILIDGREV